MDLEHLQDYTSGRWIVKEGKDSEFVSVWEDFAAWAINSRGTVDAILLRDAHRQESFISMASWRDAASIESAIADPKWQEFVRRLEAMCDYTEVVQTEKAAYLSTAMISGMML